uniref:NADAR domain-containing protein n=1 Tax=Meloidogyne enterolobii TaxID=390850 RepID=A0A6V7XN32_MELEN|nr:unnamed protein product [Meloidogyne enterolobii]
MISDPDMVNLSGQFTKLNVNQEPLCYNSHPPTEIIGKEGQKIFIFQSSRTCGFSNRFPSRFSVLGINFTTMEKYFTWQKARYFADFEIAEHILQLQNPDQITRIGHRIRGFKSDEWNKVRDKIMYMGLWAKFTQNVQLFKQLRETGNALIAEATEVNKYWTCGIWSSDLHRLSDPSSWDGENKLGDLLMELRKEINECIF